MAEIPRKDRAAIKSDIALSRDRLGRELSGLRYELDIPRKLKFISRPNRDLDRSAGGGGIADRGRAGAKEKGLHSRERQLSGKRQRPVGGGSADWRLEICRDFASAGLSEICDQQDYWLFEIKIASNAVIS